MYEKHGMKKTRVYSQWKAMKARCNKKTKVSLLLKYYVNKGVTVCEEWLNSFTCFYKDMGDPPSRYHSLDRIDPTKGYCKSNCRWATDKEQSLNRVFVRDRGLPMGVHVRKTKNSKKYPGGVKYIAQISIENKNKHLGVFSTPEEASDAYKKARPENKQKYKKDI